MRDKNRDKDGLILTTRNPEKRKARVIFEGVYEIRPDVFRAQFQFSGLTINLGEFEDMHIAAKVYSEFYDESGVFILDNLKTSNIRDLLSMHLKSAYLKEQIEPIVMKWENKGFVCKNHNDFQTLLRDTLKNYNLNLQKIATLQKQYTKFPLQFNSKEDAITEIQTKYLEK